MMKNYERYLNTTPAQYDSETLVSFFCRLLPDRKIVPLLTALGGKKILDVGLGTGRYTSLLLSKNIVIGVDRNPHLCSLPIKMYKGDAARLSSVVNGEKFDVVLSTWMTEYLNSEQMTAFFAEVKKVLTLDGLFITTVISRFGLGFIYVKSAALLKGIDKYAYSKRQISHKMRKAGFDDFRIIDLNSWFCVPWAYLVIAK